MERDDILAQFQDITSLQDTETARALLSRYEWNLDRAVQAFMQNGLAAPTSPSPSAAPNVIPSGIPGTPRETEANHQNLSLVQRIVGGLLKVITAPFSTEAPVFGSEAALRFVNSFEREYGTEHPNFFQDSFKQAATAASRQHKFLLVYLHSPLHQDTDNFCRHTLATPACQTFMNERFIVWAGSLEHSEACMVSDSIQTSSFPFIAVLLCGSSGSNQQQCIDRIEVGSMKVEDLTQRLSATLARNQNQLDLIEMQQRQRTTSVQLRQEQDQEFERALEEDQRREAEAQTERLQREQEEEDAQNKAELDAALALSQKLSKEATLKRKRDSLGAEPPNGPEITKLRLQLPNGSKIDRRFFNTDTLEIVRDYIDVYLGDNEILITSYSLSTNYPKRVFEDGSVTLLDAGLHPQCVVYVQDLNA